MAAAIHVTSTAISHPLSAVKGAFIFLQLGNTVLSTDFARAQELVLTLRLLFERGQLQLTNMGMYVR
jgi:hypothetical protein